MSCMLKLCILWTQRFIWPPNLVSREQKQQAMDVEEGVIPDSPVLTSSFSMVNRMRRKKENRHIRYTEHTQPDLELTKSSSGKRWYCLVGFFFKLCFKNLKDWRLKNVSLIAKSENKSSNKKSKLFFCLFFGL